LAGLDLCSPAPYHAYNRNRCIGSFAPFGTILEERLPIGACICWTSCTGDGRRRAKGVSAFGGKYVIDDNGEIPDTLEVVFEYPASP